MGREWAVCLDSLLGILHVPACSLQLLSVSVCPRTKGGIGNVVSRIVQVGPTTSMSSFWSWWACEAIWNCPFGLGRTVGSSVLCMVALGCSTGHPGTCHRASESRVRRREGPDGVWSSDSIGAWILRSSLQKPSGKERV